MTTKKPKKTKKTKIVKKNKSEKLVIDGQEIALNSRQKMSLHVGKLYDFTEMSIPIEVIRGDEPGPRLFVSAAIHGDEINGVEIARRLLSHRDLGKIKGTLIVIPIVNVFGFNTNDRYLPDRRDLNRMFPGKKTGALASRMAHIFMTEIVEQCTHGIDLHTAAINRANLPQIRAVLDDKETAKIARAFNVPVILDTPVLKGSLRHAARERKIPTVLFEGGEALRFNEAVIKSGLQGILSVMHAIGMLPPVKKKSDASKRAYIAKSRHWIRAPHSGILVTKKHLGQRVKEDELLGIISDPFGEDGFEIRARAAGIIVGISVLPLLNDGDAVFHIATFEDSRMVKEQVDLYEEALGTSKGSRFLS